MWSLLLQILGLCLFHGHLCYIIITINPIVVSLLTKHVLGPCAKHFIYFIYSASQQPYFLNFYLDLIEDNNKYLLSTYCSGLLKVFYREVLLLSQMYR